MRDIAHNRILRDLCLIVKKKRAIKTNPCVRVSLLSLSKRKFIVNCTRDRLYRLIDASGGRQMVVCKDLAHIVKGLVGDSRKDFSGSYPILTISAVVLFSCGMSRVYPLFLSSAMSVSSVMSVIELYKSVKLSDSEINAIASTAALASA